MLKGYHCNCNRSTLFNFFLLLRQLMEPGVGGRTGRCVPQHVGTGYRHGYVIVIVPPLHMEVWRVQVKTRRTRLVTLVPVQVILSTTFICWLYIFVKDMIFNTLPTINIICSIFILTFVLIYSLKNYEYITNIYKQ